MYSLNYKLFIVYFYDKKLSYCLLFGIVIPTTIRYNLEKSYTVKYEYVNTYILTLIQGRWGGFAPHLSCRKGYIVTKYTTISEIIFMINKYKIQVYPCIF